MVHLPGPANFTWRNERFSVGYARSLLKKLAEKAGVKKRVNPHAFRHARATFLAKHLTEAQMKEFFGWVQNSDMPAIYVHLSGRDVDNALLGVYGIKEGEKAKEPTIKIQVCPRCNEKNDPAAKFCRRCYLPLDQPYDRMDKAEAVIIAFLEQVIKEFPRVREIFREVVEKEKAQNVFKQTDAFPKTAPS